VGELPGSGLYLPVLSPGRERRDERGARRGEKRRGEEHVKMMAWGDEPERTREGFQTIVSRQKAGVRWKELLSVFF
jgi:hypothetical protein